MEKKASTAAYLSHLTSKKALARSVHADKLTCSSLLPYSPYSPAPSDDSCSCARFNLSRLVTGERAADQRTLEWMFTRLVPYLESRCVQTATSSALLCPWRIGHSRWHEFQALGVCDSWASFLFERARSEIGRYELLGNKIIILPPAGRLLVGNSIQEMVQGNLSGCCWLILIFFRKPFAY